MASVRGIHRNSLTLGTGALSSTASPYLRTCPQHTMLRQKRTCGLRMTRCASGSPSASWPGLACWLNHTSHDVEGMMKQGAQGFKKFWADYKEKYDTQGKEEWPQVTREESTGYFSDAIVGQALRVEVVKYGEMVQAVYDTLETKDINSHFFGKVVPDAMVPGKALSRYDDMGIITLRSEEGRQYKVVRIIEADCGGYKLKKQEEHRNYVGYIAEGPPDAEGGVDIAVVFRGTITTDEWLQDIKALQVCWNDGRPVVALPRSHASGDLWHKPWTTLQWAWWGSGNACTTVVDREDAHISFGFKEMYADAQAPLTPTDPVAPSPRLTVMTTLAKLLEKYQSPVDSQKRHIKSITVTGHSLGGALASLCAWDIGNIFKNACTEPTGLKASNSKLQELTSLPVKAVKSVAVALGLARKDQRLYDQRLYDLTDQQRHRVKEAVKKLQMSKAPLPAVMAVTFAAPMVGNTTYARNFKITGCTDQPVQTGMLRVVDTADVVPKLPSFMLPFLLPSVKLSLTLPLALPLTLVLTLPLTLALTLPLALALTLALTLPLTLALKLAFALALVTLTPLSYPQLFSYEHGGQELEVDYNDVPYFINFGQLPGVRARHNQEMHLHLLDPTRDLALANKTERVLIPGQNVPGSWWSPVPNHRMIETKRGKWQQVSSTRKALEWYAARAPHDDGEASQVDGHTDSKDNTKVHEASARMVNVP